MGDRLAVTGESTTLRGRTRERAVLDGLIAAIRRGESQSLVLRGEAGIGKTALLEYLVDAASDLTLARAVGVESEMELPFASLHHCARRCSTGAVGCRLRSGTPSRSCSA
jgi:ABC-type nitrate/sulfonate/bicarbonate transport system ATPase subunit